jgi:hypothetical protein
MLDEPLSDIGIDVLLHDEQFSGLSCMVKIGFHSASTFETSAVRDI